MCFGSKQIAPAPAAVAAPSNAAMRGRTSGVSDMFSDRRQAARGAFGASNIHTSATGVKKHAKTVATTLSNTFAPLHPGIEEKT